MRKVGITVGTIILVLILAVVVFAATFNVNQYRGTIHQNLKSASIGESCWAICIWVYFRHACKYRTCRLLTIRNSMTRDVILELTNDVSRH